MNSQVRAGTEKLQKEMLSQKISAEQIGWRCPYCGMTAKKIVVSTSLIYCSVCKQQIGGGCCGN